MTDLHTTITALIALIVAGVIFWQALKINWLEDEVEYWKKKRRKKKTPGRKRGSRG